jgi:outer membrane protein assembly factor BamB
MREEQMREQEFKHSKKQLNKEKPNRVRPEPFGQGRKQHALRITHYALRLASHALLAAVYLCFPVLADKEMKPINPPIEKWKDPKPLSSNTAEIQTTGQSGNLAMTRRGELLIVDANDGSEKARIPIGVSKYTVTDDNKVYVAEYGTGLIAYNLAETGEPQEIRWQGPDLPDIIHPPLYSHAQKRLYVLSESGELYAVTVDNAGRYSAQIQDSRVHFSGIPLASLAEERGNPPQLLIADSGGTLHWIRDDATGVKTFNVNGAASDAPIVFDQRAYLIVLGRTLTAVDLNGDPDPLWQHSLPGVATGNVVVGAVNRQLYAYVPIGRKLYAFRIDDTDCREVWASREFPGLITQPAKLYRQEVLVGTTDVVAFDAETGAETWSYNRRIQSEEDRRVRELEGEKKGTLTPAERQEVRKEYPQIDAELDAPIRMIGNVIYCSFASGRLFAFSTAYPRFLYWVYEPGASLEAKPVVVGDTVLVGSTTGTIYAVPTSGSGKTEEDSVVNESIVGLTPAGDTFYVVTRRGRVFKRNLPTLGAAPGWNPVNLVDDIRVPPVLGQDTLYVAGARKNRIYAVNGETARKSGELSLPDANGLKSAPSFGNQVMVLGTDAGQLKGIYADRNTLSEAWSINVGNAISGGVATDGRGRFYVGDEVGSLHVVDAKGNPMWRQPVSSAPIRSTPVWDSMKVYVTADDGAVACFSDSNGSKDWIVHPRGGTSRETIKAFSPISYDYQTLLVPFEDGWLYVLEKTNGNTLWRYQFPDRIATDATENNGALYIVTKSGYLFAVQPKKIDGW